MNTATLTRAAVLTVGISLTGTALGLGRDLLLARYFGAGGGTDAFLVAWTVPETAYVLVVEGAMSLLMIPLFSAALAHDGDARTVVATTLPRITFVLVTVCAMALAAAPLLVRVLAPGLATHDVAVTCTRWTALTVLTFGLAGYLSAALRAHQVFGAPAALTLVYNLGIVGSMVLLHHRAGVVGAAAGVALGGLFMVLVQVPSYLRRVGLPRFWRLGGSALTVGAVLPVIAYTLARQGQVFVERFVGSGLPPGTISHLNYAQKIDQIPMLIALLICAVTFPALARDVAAGEVDQARRRVESDLRTVTALILVSVAFLIAYAPQVIAVLLQHGQFTAADTAATATVTRVYALGVLGHAFVGVLARPFYTGGQRTWYPVAAMAAGLGLTAVLAAAGAPALGAPAIAAANGVGITVTALLLLIGVHRRVLPISVHAIAGTAGRLVLAAAAACAAGLLAARLTTGLPSLVQALAGGLVVLAVFAVAARLAGFHEWRLRDAG
ncbi:lipid II flippase MurJ [Actinoplanes oblitus]|uniref:Lipid II flippase MurJ n=1 Tax=Actinoplanes oblitus TaxID=3040509 RepID=A0ABY8W770_9ACTN|nr:lipid II flippase MurJ [Actinoplanes oblitus]WIM92883.1 lipid II flippase MurJ [Actinoplanes oblitus]